MPSAEKFLEGQFAQLTVVALVLLLFWDQIASHRQVVKIIAVQVVFLRLDSAV